MVQHPSDECPTMVANELQEPTYWHVRPILRSIVELTMPKPTMPPSAVDWCFSRVVTGTGNTDLGGAWGHVNSRRLGR